ncbi:MAG: Na-K-Cl cotransporter [SAR324 cluster bacterium]|nr:Na-K-Cl cotransporter [SAR324 cluster bacterium]
MDTDSDKKSTPPAPDQNQQDGKKFGTFHGVFRPTILTILGVMMYLREGWVVGNAGLLGVILIILMAYVITGTSALAISSITTNIRLGAGGVFSIVSQSLGLEVGGSIGLPFYLAQGLSTAMYIYGFVEGWLYIFPTHIPMLVSFIVFAVIFILSYISTTLAFRVQLVVMCGVILALTSILLGAKVNPIYTPEWWGGFQDVGFWGLFAIFFPAATGIMVGASMSGNLKTPRTSIYKGTLIAWALSLVVYLSLAVWYACIATPEELRSNLTIAVDRAYWGPAVLLGILSSCFTAALSSFVAAPRILQSLAKHQIVPLSEFLGKLHQGEPRNAMAFTALLVFLTLLLGDLNTIAQVLTMFFLLTYFTINSVLLIEQQLNLISFRPTFSISQGIPLIGAMSCLSAIVIINPFWGMIAILLSVGIYFYLDRRGLDYPWETVRSGLFVAIANWAAKKVVTSKEQESLRSWKPDLLIPIERRTQFEGNFRLLSALVYPQGSIQVIALMKEKDILPLLGLKQLINEMQSEGIFASSAIIDSSDYISSIKATVAVMKGSFFQPNTFFTAIEGRTQEELQGIMDIARENQMGVALFATHPEVHLGRERTINLWIRDQSPEWQLSIQLANLDLSLLLGYKLVKNWNARLRVITVVSDENHVDIARKYLGDLMVTARIPKGYEIIAEYTDFKTFLEKSPRADLSIFGLADTISKNFLQQTMIQTKSSCLFVQDSGRESALA